MKINNTSEIKDVSNSDVNITDFDIAEINIIGLKKCNLNITNSHNQLSKSSNEQNKQNDINIGDYNYDVHYPIPE